MRVALLLLAVWAGCDDDVAQSADMAMPDLASVVDGDVDSAVPPDLAPVACAQCATPFCAFTAPDAGLATNCPGLAADQDHDGLSDAWEVQGYVDVNCNGINDGEGIDVQSPARTSTRPTCTWRSTT